MKTRARSSVLPAAISALASLALLGTLAACGIGESGDDSVQAKIQRDNEKLAGTYGSISGTYTGVLQTGGTEQGLPAELQVYVVSQQDGVDPNNAPKSRLVLKAQLKLLGVGELDDTNFNADYSDFDGRIALEQPAAAGASPGGAAGAPSGTVSECPVGPKDPRLSVNGHILNGELKDGLVSGTNGLVGTLVLHRTEANNKQPLRDQPERLRKAYQRILGTYEGGVISTIIDPVTQQPVNKSADTQVIVRIVENPIVGGNTCPSLVGQFKYTKIVGKLDDSQFAVSFRESTNEIFFTGATAKSSSSRVCPVGPNDAQLAIDGRVDKDRAGKLKLTGILKGTAGNIGDLDLTWKNASTVAEDDQAARLQVAYSAVAGTYGGRFKDNDPSHVANNYNFPVSIRLDLVNTVIGGFVRCPALLGQYSRPDLYDNIGNVRLSADFFPFERTLSLKNSAPESGGGVGGGIPGHNFINITGFYTGKDFTGDMAWYQGTGVLKVKFCKSGRVDKNGSCI